VTPENMSVWGPITSMQQCRKGKAIAHLPIDSVWINSGKPISEETHPEPTRIQLSSKLENHSLLGFQGSLTSLVLLEWLEALCKVMHHKIFRLDKTKRTKVLSSCSTDLSSLMLYGRTTVE